MSFKYDQLYSEHRHALGDQTPEIITAFDTLGDGLEILDVGCGQGRDALPLARLGHKVHAFDLSAAGIAQLQEEADAEGLSVFATVADLLTFSPSGTYDVVLIDRTLHMLDATDRIDVLRRLVAALNEGGYLFIADEPSNLPAFRMELAQSERDWHVIKDKGQYLFLHDQGRKDRR